MRTTCFLLLAFSLLFLPALFGAETVAEKGGPIEWQRDYAAARQQAIDAGKGLLIYCSGRDQSDRGNVFIGQTCFDAQVQHLAENYICLRVSKDDWRLPEGHRSALFDQISLDAIRKVPGLVVVDFCDPQSPTYGHIVGWLPFETPTYYAPDYESARSVATFLGLPCGSLTQRMLIYAIRIHPEGAESTSGLSSPGLLAAATQHAQRQANLQRQGHHHWDQRFRKLWPIVGGKPPVEICAESWPDESLLRACLGCVHAWRQSAGHWRAVANERAFFGYDICRGKNGIWYATGILGG